jgi:malate dehydrogenase (oxaloacetate-decarboxylating)(NADP+)
VIRDEDALEYHSSFPPGKISIHSTKPCLTQRDLSLAYTPGVAAPCLEIHRNPELVYKYTAKANLVAVISNGTAVLGLGNLGAAASKPVMEGKGVLFKRFADIDVFDIELGSTDAKEIIHACKLLEPTFGGINLEDIKAPECFEIEEELRRTMAIPVFHDDQHGTAIISGAALLNAVEIAGKQIGALRVVINGAGASAIACAEHYIRLGVRRANITMCDTSGVIFAGRTTGMNRYKERFAVKTAARTLSEALQDADAFFGFSAGNCVTGQMLAAMSVNPIVFALANPDPEIAWGPAHEARPDIIMGTGRSDLPNQVNNVLGFPAIFRGALDVRASTINDEMMLAATHALAELAKEDVPESVCRIYGVDHLEFGRHYIIPKPFDSRVVIREAAAVARAAMATGVARLNLDPEEYKESLERRLGTSPAVMRTVIRKARSEPQTIVFPEGEEDKIIRSAQILIDEDLASPILLGNEGRIRARAAILGLKLEGSRIVDPQLSPRTAAYVTELYSRRQRKGVTRREAMELMQNPDMFGAMMVHLNDAAAMICGLTRHYSDALRPALQVIPMQPGIGKVAGMYIVVTPRGKLYFLADCTVNIDPSPETMAEIAACAAGVAREFDVEPQIAFLSFSNFGNSAHSAAVKVREAVRIARERFPEIPMDGEMQADTAVVREIIDETYPFCAIRGGANVLIFPNLDAGNIAYKLLARLGGAQVIGPVLMGLSRPVHILQRGATVNDIVNVAAVAAVEAQHSGTRSIGRLPPAQAGAL